jgi:cyclopropane fatty-acyl-phospholipid synthase-like methyltransferase
VQVHYELGGIAEYVMCNAEQVIATYERIAREWRDARTANASTWPERALVDRLISGLLPGSQVLDVGCGPGEPITAYLSKRGLRVVGVDASSRMLDMAREAVPTATFLLGDMRTTDPGGLFDALIAWDSVFHLPRDEHRGVFSRFHSWLRPGAPMLVSLGGSGETNFTSEMLGERFFYSGHEPEEALSILGRVGFQIEHWELDDPFSRGHIAILAVRDAA